MKTYDKKRGKIEQWLAIMNVAKEVHFYFSTPTLIISGAPS